MLDLGQAAEELLQLCVGPRAGRFQGAAAEGLPQLAESGAEGQRLLFGEAAGVDELFDDAGRGVEQVVPAGEALFEHVVSLLVGAFAGVAGEDDVDQLVGRVGLVAEVGGAIEDGEDAGDLAEIADAVVEAGLDFAILSRSERATGEAGGIGGDFADHALAPAGHLRREGVE